MHLHDKSFAFRFKRLILYFGQGGYATKVVRSKDLITWEQAAEAVLDFKQPGMVAADKGKPPRTNSAYYYTNFTATMVGLPSAELPT